MKKKLHPSTPARRALPRVRRLAKAKEWILAYTGKKIVSAYAKHYRVDLPCAMLELRLLGIAVSEQYEQAVKQTLTQLALKKKQQQEEENIGMTERDDWGFAFIAGYTSGGFPYGIRWEEMPPEDEE